MAFRRLAREVCQPPRKPAFAHCSRKARAGKLGEWDALAGSIQWDVQPGILSLTGTAGDGV